MRVLWICNMILPEFASYFNVKRSCFGGWMSGLYKLLCNNTDIDIALAFPIYDKNRKHDFSTNGTNIYSYDGMMDQMDIDDGYIYEFTRIFETEKPDLVHIWGTEYNHSYYAVRAAKDLNIINKTLVDIQGIVSYISKHYLDEIPVTVIDDPAYELSKNSLKNEYEHFLKQGYCEKILLGNVKYVTGRTDWDYACVKSINSKLTYFFNNRILRESFYNHAGLWKIETCTRHRVFLSNASYALKGFHVFILAIRELVLRYEDLTVIIAGPNPIAGNDEEHDSQYGDYLHHLINENGIESHIRFVGSLNEEQMVSELIKANVFVATSTVENSCNSLCEAMMIGTPLVSAFSGGLSSLIDNKVNGFLYQTNAPYMAVHYISQIFDDDSIAQKISVNANKTAIERHNKRKIIDETYNIYERIYNT